MQHWINQSQMNFYVGKRSGIVTECCPVHSNIEGAFRSEAKALDFAKTLQDGLNFIMIYGNDGKTVHVFGPNFNWK